jgi:hypothetical protein
VAEQWGGAAGAAAAAGTPVGCGDPAGSAVTAGTDQQPAAAAGTAEPACPAMPAHSTVAYEAGGSAGTSGSSRIGARATVAAAAEQDPAGPARRTHTVDGLPVGAVADQRAPHQQLGGCVDRTQHLLLQGLQRRGAGGLRSRVGSRARVEGLHELVVEQRRPGAECLVCLAVRAEQVRNGSRHLIGAGSQHHGGGGRRGRIGRADRGPDVRQTCRRRCHYFRRCNHKRHCAPPDNSATA